MHRTRIYDDRRLFERRPRYIAGCFDCPWTHETADHLDAVGQAKIHAERAGRTVR